MTKTIYMVTVRAQEYWMSTRYTSAKIAGEAYATLAAQLKPGELAKVTVDGKIVRIHRG